jgi:hypothetical protein
LQIDPVLPVIKAWKTWLPALLLLVTSFVATTAVALRPSEAVGAPVAAVFPPWWDGDRAIAAAAAADATIVREGAWSNILVLTSTSGDFAARLHAAGAWLLLDPKALASCLKEHS